MKFATSYCLVLVVAMAISPVISYPYDREPEQNNYPQTTLNGE